MILGRGSQAALAGRQDVLHVSLVGDLPDRVRRIMESQRMDQKEATARCHRMDAERAAYVKRFYGVDESPTHYDLVVNTDVLSFDHAAELVAAAAMR